MILAVKFKQTYNQTKRYVSKGIPIEETGPTVRKSIKDMTVKYWQYRQIKNKLDDIDIVVGLYQGVIYSAFRVEKYKIVNRNGMRVEFVCNESVDHLIGISLGTDASKGGWTIKTYPSEVIQEISKDSSNRRSAVNMRKSKILDEFKELKIPYETDIDYDYDFRNYGKNKIQTRINPDVRKKTFSRSNGKCEICGKSADRCHHILRQERGGAINDLNNTMGLCEWCHGICHQDNNRYDTIIYPILKQYREHTYDTNLWAGIRTLLSHSKNLRTN
ncbi:MAG: hypothetical protein K0S47_4448 [Herbinix sp.]|jgi:hypothetical protein|nr:hypothetical protein [Herbinix sp.]